MPFFLWLLAGLLGGGLAGISALMLYLRRAEIDHPHPLTLVIKPEEDFTLERDESGVHRLISISDEIPVRIRAGDITAPENMTTIWEATQEESTPPETFDLTHPGFTRPVFELTFADGRISDLSLRDLRLQGAANIRDIGGYRTAEGRQVRWGLLYRAGELSNLTVADQRVLHTLGVKIVCDLRSSEEVTGAPDRLHEYGGIDYRHMEVQTDRSASQRDRQRAVLFQRNRLGDMMPEIYTRVGLEHNARLNGDILRMLADRDNLPTIIHCTAGKDRTGVIVALLLLALGVPEETIIADYSLSNRAWATFQKIGADAIRPLAFLGLTTRSIQPLLVADPATMRITLDYIREKYDTVDSYLTTQAGLDARTIEALKSVFLA